MFGPAEDLNGDGTARTSANRQLLERHNHEAQNETVGDQARARELRSKSKAHLTIGTLTRAQNYMPSTKVPHSVLHYHPVFVGHKRTPVQ